MVIAAKNSNGRYYTVLALTNMQRDDQHCEIPSLGSWLYCFFAIAANPAAVITA